MTKLEPIPLLEALREQATFHTAVYFTYGADLAFFEEAVLYLLWQKGCRQNLVFMDGERYADTVNDLHGSVGWAGRRYIVVPVNLGSWQSFHPKMVLLLGAERGRLLVGSGNLTFTGFGRNHEVFTCLNWTPEQPDLLYLFIQAWNLANTVLQRWGHSAEAEHLLAKTRLQAAWLNADCSPPAAIQFLHTLDEPLLEQCYRAIGKRTVTRLTVVTPFLDDSAHALEEIYRRFRPKALRLVVQDERAVGNVQSLKHLRRGRVPLEVHRFSDTERYLHAKIYLFETVSDSYLLTGSANCTRAAWLSTSNNGNVEIMLLRHADSVRQFQPLLANRIAPRAISSLDKLHLQERRRPVSVEQVKVTTLLDVALVGGQLAVEAAVYAAPEVADLRLRLSTTPTCWIPLGPCRQGELTFQVTMPAEMLGLSCPLSASLWGSDAAGQLVDLGSNELWINHIDVLRRQPSILAPTDTGTGKTLGQMLAETAKEWRDLYDTLIQFVELDAVAIKRRGSPYTATRQPPSPAPPREEAETTIRIVPATVNINESAQIEAKLYAESQFYAWFQLARGQLPGLPTTTQLSAPSDTAPPSFSGSGHDRPRWTPEERIRRAFTNLVKKYIKSLHNVAFMRTLSTHLALAYYVVFQRLLWFLRIHLVIEDQQFIELAIEINAGFFGSPEEDPAAICSRLASHFHASWHENWQTHGVPAYALAGAVTAEELATQLADEDLLKYVHEQTLRVFCGIATVLDVSRSFEDKSTWVEVAEMYGQDPASFANSTLYAFLDALPVVAGKLESWQKRIGEALQSRSDQLPAVYLYDARVACWAAQFEAAGMLHDTEAQSRQCFDLLLWMRCTDDAEAIQQLTASLSRLLPARGNLHEMARALVSAGKASFYAKQYPAAANVLRQAHALAEQVGNKELCEQCQQFLTWTEFFVR